MSDLISRSALLEAIHNAGGCGAAKGSWDDGYDRGISVAFDITENAPAVDAVPVVHGRWLLLDECSNEGVYCSVCHKKVYRTEYANQKVKSNYCPNCGAKMDGGKDNG